MSGDKAYLLSCDTHPSFQTGIKARSRLEVLNVLNPAQPVLLGAYDSPRVIASLDVVGTLAYLGLDPWWEFRPANPRLARSDSASLPQRYQKRTIGIAAI